MTTVVEPPAQAAEPQSARGRARLTRMLAAATELFLRDGYDQTSIDAILERSGGSKATLYAYFPTKEELFRAVIDGVMINVGHPELDVTRDVRTTLTEFAVDRLHVIFSPQHRAVLRLIIAERERFPDLASLYFERGPQRFRAVHGALLLSTQGDDIDQMVTNERLAILKIGGVASAVMIMLSLLLASTIAGPVRRLADSAERVRRRIRTRVEIPDFTRRRDEIGHLSGALRDMLQNHLLQILSLIAMEPPIAFNADEIRARKVDVLRAIRLSKATVTKMKQNLFWASIYNILAIPVAAGVLYPSFGIELRPEWAALLMSISSIIVATNAVLLKRVEGELASP